MVGITGVGGGALMTPILVLLFGVSPAAAIGTDLWFAAITKMVGGTVHHRKGSVDWQVFKRLCLGSLPASVITLIWLQQSNVAQMKNGLLLNALGGVLLLTAVAMVFKRQTHALGQKLRSQEPERFKGAQPALTVVAGALLGFLVTLTSIGAGALGAVMLLALYPYRMNPARLVELLGKLLLGSIPGIVLGSLIGSRTPERVLRAAISVVLVAVGAKLLVA